MNENENIEPVEPVQSANIVDYLVNLLSSVGLNSYFIHKPDGKKELDYIIYNTKHKALGKRVRRSKDHYK